MSDLRVGFGWALGSTAVATREALEKARAGLGDARPALALLTSTVGHPAATAFATLQAELPDVPVHGVTTSLALLAREGIISDADGVVGVLLLASAGALRFAARGAPLEGHPRALGREVARALREALGERPAFVLFGSSPGPEEDLIAGIAEALPGVRLHGGSAADDAIAGEWSVYTDDGPRKDALSLAGIAGKLRVGTALYTPYVEAGPRARVTKSEDRHLVTLDDQPAAEVLGRWLDGGIDAQLERGGNVLAQTALAPIAVKKRTGGDDAAPGEHFVTVHPANVRPDRSLDVFARLEEGDTVCLMRGSEDSLANLEPLLQQALENGRLAPSEVKLALLIYCAGCAGAVGPKLEEGLRAFAARLPEATLLGLCTFGEQGHVPGLGNVHQDLSLSLLLVG